MKDLKWPAVAVIVALLLVLAWLSDRGKDATVVLAGVFTVLGALGYGVLSSKQADLQNSQTEIKQNTDTIKEQTNGNIGQMMAMLEQQGRDHRRDMKEMADKLAFMVPPDHPGSVSGAGVYADKEHRHSADL